MVEFDKVKNEQIKTLADLASEIWHEYWGIILSPGQIDYMVEKFQSEKAIEEQITNENYDYYFIKNEGENIGYFGISNQSDALFLSKLYIKNNFRGKGIGRKAFEKIKQIKCDLGLPLIRLTVNKYNKNTIAAYEKWGLKIVDAVVTDIGSGFVMDDYIMEY